MSRTLLDLKVGFVALAEDGLEGIKAVLDAHQHVRDIFDFAVPVESH